MLFIPCGGLCNRIQNIVSAMVWSEETGKPAKFLWTVSDEIGNGRFEDYFEPDNRFTNVQDVTQYLHRARRFVSDTGVVHFWGFTHVDGEGDDVNGYPNGYNRLLRGMNKGLLKPANHIKKISDEYCIANDIKNRIGVHIRDFEHAMNFNGNRSGDPEGITKNFLKVMNHQDRYSLCSDSSEVRQRIIKEFPNTVYRKENDTGSKYSERNTIEGTTNGFIDLLTLSQCKYIMGTRSSSFSFMASVINNIPLKWIDSPRYDLYKNERWAQSAYLKEDRP
jgi:hypothetical protein